MKNNYSYRKDLCLKIAALEATKVGQARYEFNGIDIWPVLRADLCKAIEESVIAPGRFLANVQPALKAFEKQLRGAQESSQKVHTDRFVDELPAAKSGTRLMFHTRAIRHQLPTYGESVCGQIDFLYRLLEDKFDCIKVEEFTARAGNLCPRFVEPHYYKTSNRDDFVECVNTLSSNWYWPEESRVREHYDALFEALGVSEDRRDFAGLRKRLALMHAYAHVFDDILRRLNPAAVFTELYYNPEVWGLILAAKRLGIPTVEIQHGLVGRYQWIMTHWTSIPESGFDLLPDYFWCFDEETKENLNDANSTDKSFHSIVGGIPRLVHWANQKDPAVGPDCQRFLSDLTKCDFVVLVALNYADHVPENLLFAIKRLPKSWRWLIRLHPMSKPAQSLIEQAYRAQGLENVEFHYATRVPIYDLLNGVDHLVTGYSTLATEALPFGMGITLADTTGSELYPQFIADGRMTVGITGDTLCSVLKAAASQRQSAEKVSSAPQIADRSASALDELLEDFKLRGQANKQRSQHLDQSAFFQINPIDRVRDESQAMHEARDEQKESQVTSEPRVLSDPLPANQSHTSKDEIKGAHPVHTVDDISILPILQAHWDCGKVEDGLPGKLLADAIEEHLKAFEKRLHRELQASRVLVQPNKPALSFYDLEQRGFNLARPKIKRCRLLFVSRAEQHCRRATELYESPLDVFVKDLSSTFDTVKTEVYRDQSLISEPRKLPTKYIRTPWDGEKTDFVSEFFEGFQWCSEEEIAAGLDALAGTQGAVSKKSSLKRASVSVALSAAYMEFFELALKAEWANAVFIDEFECDENWGATLAAKNLGIPVIQIVPSRLSACLKKAEARRKLVGHADGFLPDYYWCTSEPWEGGIGAAKPALNFVFRALPNGQPQFLEMPNDSSVFDLTSEERSYKKFLESADHVVMVALSDSYSVPQTLLDAMKELPPTWLWLIRVPRLGLHGADSIERRLIRAGIDNFELQFASQLPLFKLISQVGSCVIVEDSIECELRAAEIDFLLLSSKEDFATEEIVCWLLKDAHHQSFQAGVIGSKASDVLDVVLSDWRVRKSPDRDQSEKPRFGALRDNIPDMQTVWRQHYLRQDVRASQYSLNPQITAPSSQGQVGKIPAATKSHGKGGGEPGIKSVHERLDLLNTESAVQHIGSKQSLKIAAKLTILALRRKAAPRRRLQNTYQSVRAMLKAVPRIPSASGLPSTLSVMVDLALIETDKTLFSFIHAVDQHRRNGDYKDCRLIVFYYAADLNGLQNWSNYSSIAPIFTSLLPSFESVHLIPDQKEASRLLQPENDSDLFLWNEGHRDSALTSGDLIPSLLTDSCNPIVADEESKRFVHKWKDRICRGKQLVTISFGDEPGNSSENLISLLSDTVQQLQKSAIEVVVIPSHYDHLEHEIARIENATILDECLYNLPLLAAFFEIADRNILIGGGVNALAALNSKARWCYIGTDIVKPGSASQTNNENVVFEEIPTVHDILSLLVDQSSSEEIEEAVEEASLVGQNGKPN